MHFANVYAYITGQGLNNGYGGALGPMLAGHEDVFHDNLVIQVGKKRSLTINSMRLQR